MKASVIAGLKWEPEMRALKISNTKKPQRRPTKPPPIPWNAELKSEVRSNVPRNSKRRIRSDSLNVVMQSCE